MPTPVPPAADDDVLPWPPPPEFLLTLDGVTPEVRRMMEEAERLACKLDFAPSRCPRRDCRRANRCCMEAELGQIHRACEGRPGFHTSQWIVGFWLAALIAPLGGAREQGRAGQQ